MNDLKSCREQLDSAKKETSSLESRYEELKKNCDKSGSTASTEKQELLDKNIQCMEDNKNLLKQIVKLKGVNQEKKDAQWRLDKAHENLQSLLNSERVNDQLYIIKNEDRIKIVIPQRVLFPSPTSAWLTPNGVAFIKKIAKCLDKLKPQEVEVAGHTDNVPLSRSVSKSYPTTWDLGNARAVSVLMVLEGSGIKRDKLSSVSYGDTRPIADSATEEGKAMNRRVEIIITP